MGTKKHVLLVEDDEVLARGLCRGLRHIVDWAVTTTTSISAAENHLETEPCDLVILDLILSDGCGTRLLRFLEAANFQIPVIVVSGNLNKDLRATFASADIHVLEKPCELQDLVTLAENSFMVVPRHGSHRGQRYCLSNKQIEIVQCGCQELTTKETAERLDCSESTIYTQWNRIMAKTGCRDREAVIAMVLEQVRKSRIRTIYDKIDQAVQRLYSNSP